MLQKRSMMIAAILIALVSLAFVAVACGDDDDDGNGNGADPTETTEPAGDGENGPDPTETTEPADGNGDGGETTIAVELTEFSVTPSLSTAAAGTVTFSVTNSGAIFHNFNVIASDLAADALPVDDDTFAVDEDAVDFIASSADIEAGESEDLSVELGAGSYVLICNVPTHYDAGMNVAFTVE